MRMNLLSRLERLEALNQRAQQSVIRFGIYKPLPPGFVGQRHKVPVEPLPPGTPDERQYRFEERAGPAPPGMPDYGVTVWMTEADTRL